MTKDFEKLLYLFGDSALGRESTKLNIENPDTLVEISVKQGIWSCIYPDLSKICDMSKYRLDFLMFMSKAISKREFTLNILSEARDNGFKLCILKGVAVASLYDSPEYRVSGDTDILINPKDEKKFSKFLTSKGYTVEKRERTDQHMKAMHPIGGLLEAHISLNDDMTEELAFEGKFKYDEPWRRITIDSRTFYTLGINDNLLFLTGHYIRHFIAGESCIRQMMDLLLYMDKYKDEIDFASYDKLMTELHYNKLIDTIKSIGAKYFGMNYELSSDEDMDLLLTDAEKCGAFGKNSKFQTNISGEFYKYRENISKSKFKYVYWFKSKHTLASRLFPDQHILIKMGYGYAKKKYLIPIAWVHKLFDYIFKRNKVRNETVKADVINERIETMRKLAIIK